MAHPSESEAVWPFVVVGAGAAGLLAATEAARAGCPTLLLESRPKPGAKIRVSGGGRCNVLPSVVEVSDFWTSGSLSALRNVLFAWTLDDVRDHFERRLGIPLKVEQTGKVFPQSNSSREVVEALLRDLASAGARLEGGRRVVSIRPEDGGFLLACADGEPVRARRVLLATGGRSLPKTGSDGAGFGFARRLGHSIVETYPALVPLTTSDAAWGELSGISLPVSARAVRDGRTVEARPGDFLFTHRGFSGPVALDLSRHIADPAKPPATIRVNWGARDGWEGVLEPAAGGRHVGARLREELPRRLADRLLARAGVSAESPLAQLRREERRSLLGQLADCPLEIDGTEGYRTAEVTGGGVPLAEVHGPTLESRRTPGLFLAGEILDVTGRLGGYNFLWAWVTGHRVGLAAAAAHAQTAGRD